MKKLCLSCVSLLLVATFSFAQDTDAISINGVVKGVEIKQGTAWLIPISLGFDCIAYKFDTMTVDVVNNHFHFKGTMPYPHGFEEIIFRSSTASFRTASFFLNPGSINMTCFYDSTKQLAPELQFSKTNEEYQNSFLPRYNLVQSILDSFLNKRADDYKKYNKTIPDSVYNEDLKIRNEFAIQRNALLREYIKQHPNSYIPLAMLGQSVERLGFDMPEIERTFFLLSDEMRNTITGIKIKKAIQSKKFDEVSKNLAAIRLIDTSNTNSTIGFNKNKYTLVDFWFSNCHPCIMQFPQLLAVYAGYKNAGFGITGISTDEDETDWRKAISKYNIHWQQLWDKDNFTSNTLLIHSFPTNYLVDASGKIITENIEPEALKSFLEKNLK